MKLLEPSSDKWRRGVAPGGPLSRFWLPKQAALVWPLPQIRGREATHPAGDVLRRCYTGCSLLCQGEMLSKF
jgi:hypothetical protein